MTEKHEIDSSPLLPSPSEREELKEHEKQRQQHDSVGDESEKTMKRSASSTFEFDMKKHLHLTKTEKYEMFRMGLKEFVHEQEVKHGTVFTGPYKYKDCSCMHPGVECFPFTFLHMLKVLPTSIAMYAPIHLIPVIIFKRHRILKEPLTVATRYAKNVLRSALFTGFFQFGLVGCMCLSNRLFQSMSKRSTFISGFVGGTAVFFEPFGRRLEMALFFVPKVGECIINSSIEHGAVSQRLVRGILVLVFACAMATLMYFYSTRRRVIKPSILSLMTLLLGKN